MNQLLILLDSKLTSGWGFVNSILIYYGIYALCSILVVWLFLLLIPKRFLHREGRSQVIGVFFFFWFISIGIPIFGLLFSITCIIFIRMQRQDTLLLHINQVTYPIFRYEKLKFGRKYGEGGAYALAINRFGDYMSRLRALVNLNVMDVKTAYAVNRELLQEKTDDIRLYAYTLNEKKRQEILKSIRQLEEVREKQLSISQQAQVDKWLAESYWQYIYYGLLDQATEEHMILKLKEYANNALKSEEFPEIFRLFGLLSLREKNYEEAKKYFTKALELGMGKLSILPYLVEIAYFQKDYKKVREYLEMNHYAQDSIVLKPLKSFWCQTDAS